MRFRFDLDALPPQDEESSGIDVATPGKGSSSKENPSTYDRCWICEPKTPCGIFKEYEIVNYIAACLHFIQAMTAIPLEDVTIPIQESFTSWEEGDSCTANATAVLNGFTITRENETSHHLSLKWLIVVFHLLSFLFEFAVTDPFCCVFPGRRKKYNENVKAGVNYMRFVEYSASASIMLIAISLVSGIYESYALIGIGFLTFATMVLGGIAEMLFSDNIPSIESKNMPPVEDDKKDEPPVEGDKKDKRDKTFTRGRFKLTANARMLGWVCHFTGWVTMFAAYGIILRQFSFANDKAQQRKTDGAPWFVYIIVIVIFLLYNGFGLIQLCQLNAKTNPMILCSAKQEYSLGKRNNEICNRLVELLYVVNSLVSKTLLGLIIIFQVIVREDTVACEDVV